MSELLKNNENGKHSISMNLLALVFKTSNSLSPLIVRLLLGMVVFPHGAQKLFGWFNGFGFSGTMGFFTDTLGIPWLIGLLVILLETVGALALISGIATRIIAGFYIILAIGIIFSTQIQNGFFMNWMGQQQGEGYEYFLLWIGMALSLFISGGGNYSLDKKLFRQKN